ncbi:putative transferase CAF17-like [Apostichopus japonicus]|uniref:Putative transferase CAF17-like n=2 Tax=Stichopus japonicus TaxID=307972 RepID=A0A2G8LE09_STIJA|nr:putative transferase CAF17-like [Apostichopus japonicus]
MSYLAKILNTTWKSVATYNGFKLSTLLKNGSKTLSIVQRCKFCGKSIHQENQNGIKSLRVVELKDRGILQIAGVDAASLLQGVITNDMEMLEGEERVKAMYTMFLNAQGRVLYDALIYRHDNPAEPTYHIECDTKILPDLHKHLKMYRLRRKVELCDVSSDFKVRCLFDNKQFPPFNGFWVPDPRLSTFMYRSVTPSNLSVSDVAGGVEVVSVEEYRRYRYQLGLAEGVDDLPPGDTLPLEDNLVFLNGVDFSKGCYLGQELTARTHHTGVIRKRLMPVELKSSSDVIPAGSAIKTEKGRNAGKFRSQVGNSGLALLRVAYGRGELLHVVLPNGARCEMVAHIPSWWPIDLLQ